MAGTPKSYGIVLFDGFQLLDVAGPLDILNCLSTHIGGISVSLIAEDLSPKSTIPKAWPNWTGVTPYVPSQALQPTHTFDNAPDVDVLLVPGGMGTFDPASPAKPNAQEVAPIVKFVLARYPKLKYLLTVCTGSGIVSQTGLLDGKKATGFKGTWDVISQWRTEVDWQTKARWTEDGNIWTSSGVASGIDLTFAFVKSVYGEDVAKGISTFMEYERRTDSTNDPFAIAVSA